MRLLAVFLITVACFSWQSCDNEQVLNSYDEMIELRASNAKVTGDVRVAWNNNSQHNGNDMQNAPADRHALVSINAFEPDAKKEAKGQFDLKILGTDDQLHREIHAEVFDVSINRLESKAWFLAEVISDSKTCDGHGGTGGHGDGEEHEHDEGDEHDTTGGHDSGCSGNEADHGDMHVSGAQCRVGQIVAVKVHDVSTPAADGDGIAWKWFRPDAPNVPDITNTEEWPHLCMKTILEGNLVVH